MDLEYDKNLRSLVELIRYKNGCAFSLWITANIKHFANTAKSEMISSECCAMIRA